MLWEAEPHAETVDAPAEIEVASVVLDPCGNRSGHGDLLTVMNANAGVLEALAGKNG